MDRLKENYSHELMKLKRKATQSSTYDEVRAKDTINRLKNELKMAYTQNRKAFAERSDK